eukprot:m51a1_g9605 putative phosphatidylinositol- -trisphosphate 3-phosphatase and dual-specificity protein phosphatase (818) ;mRNA; f:1056921-1059976
MLSQLRGAVSKEKRRYQQFGFDLDLSYITKRIIAMGFPSESVEAAYRNPYKEVYRFLEVFHKDHYRVYNLCSERGYEACKFHNRVGVYPFDDHNAPPFEMIQRFCADVDEWLGQDPENIAVVHCKAGKGRTGLMICCYMQHCREWETSDEALAYYAAIRTFNKKGVTIPSQVRYVKYYEQLVRFNIQVGKELVFCKRIVLRPKPKLPDNADISFHMYVSQTQVYKTKIDEEKKDRSKRESWADSSARGRTLHSRLRDALVEGGENEGRVNDTFDIVTVYANKRDPDAPVGSWGDEPHVAEIPNVPLCGDICLEAYTHTGLSSEQHLFSFWFNTAFIRNGRAVFAKPEIDKAHKDKKLFAPHFVVEMFFNDAETMAAANSMSPSTATLAAPQHQLSQPPTPRSAEPAAPAVLAQLLTPSPAITVPLAQIGPLNTAQGPFPNAVQARPACVVACELLERLIDLYLRCGYYGVVLDDSVASVAHHPDFPAWQRATAELERVSVAMLRENDERTAFWLNVYNIMALHSTALLYSRRDMNHGLYSSPKDKSTQLQDAKYVIAGHVVTMQEIENCILRHSFPPADNGVESSVSFAESDDRKHWPLTVRDARIPYVLSYCTTSSPRVWVFHPATVHQELDKAVSHFMKTNSYVNIATRQAFLHRQCVWFAHDYAKRREQLEFIGRILETPGLSEYDIKYAEYDWEVRVYLDHLRLCGIPIERRATRVVASQGPQISPFASPAQGVAMPTPPSSPAPPPPTALALAVNAPPPPATEAPEAPKSEKLHAHKQHRVHRHMKSSSSAREASGESSGSLSQGAVSPTPR